MLVFVINCDVVANVLNNKKISFLHQQPYSPFALFVDNKQKRYLPQADDLVRSSCSMKYLRFFLFCQVIGTIVEKHSENYRVEIGTTQTAVLPAIVSRIYLFSIRISF